MAITKNDCTFLFYSKKLGVSFGESLMLGRLNLYASRQDIINSIDKYNNHEKQIDNVNFVDGYSEPLFEILGATKIDSIDVSAYENASIIHDLNIPIAEELKNKFTAIVDGGTIEHVFNFPVAIKNCMNALKIGGHYIGISPTNNLMGHGFYQFSPELYYRIFSESNGFRIKKMLINVNVGSDTTWYEVADPMAVNSRVGLTNNFPVSLMLVAEKIAEKNVFETIPQQSDYINTWDSHKSLSENKIRKNESPIKFLYRKLFPKRVKIIAKNLYDIVFVEKTKNEFLGEFNRKHFIKTEI